MWQARNPFTPSSSNFWAAFKKARGGLRFALAGSISVTCHIDACWNILCCLHTKGATACSRIKSLSLCACLCESGKTCCRCDWPRLLLSILWFRSRCFPPFSYFFAAFAAFVCRQFVSYGVATCHQPPAHTALPLSGSSVTNNRSQLRTAVKRLSTHT